MPVALDQFVKQLADSGVIAPGKLENFVPPKAHPKDAQELARQLVQSKHLTKFQAQEIYTGRAKSLILGNYTILDKIGAGGMGQVFKAEHRRMHRLVAIKMLPKNVTKDALAIARFQREVDAAAKLEHPNIVTAHDADDSDGVHFLVMQFVEGSDLSVLVKKHGPLSVEKAVNYILQAARGLEYAHKHGVVHRDIKPANLLLNSEGMVKILDMGLARIDTGSEAGAEAQAELTGTGAVMGTVDYMAPEQALSTKHADARADIYSLGCSLYYLITGHAAYDGDTLMAKLLAHRDSPIPSLGAAAPEQIQAVFEKMVAKSIEDRYQTMSEVVAALEQFNAGQQASLSIQPPVGSSSSSDVLTFLRNVTLNTMQKPKPVSKAAPAIAGKGNKKLLLGAIGAGLLSVAILAAVIISMRAKDPAAPKSADNGASVTGAGQGSARWENPAFKQWMSDVAAMPADKQVDAVAKKLVDLNPGFDGKAAQKFGNGLVTEFAFLTDDVTDISPVRAFPALRYLGCFGSPGKGKLADLSPLKGMKLTGLNCHDNPALADLSPIEGMPLTNLLCFSTRIVDLTPLARTQLTQVNCIGTPVSDLSPLRDMPLVELHCCYSWVSDLSPLASCQTLQILDIRNFPITPEQIEIIETLKNLKSLDLEAAKMSAADIASLRHALPNCTIAWDGPAVANQMAETPAFKKWMKAVAILPPDQKAAAVAKKLVEVNRGFDGIITGIDGKGPPKIENGVVTEVALTSDKLTDISPVRALIGLKSLDCKGNWGGKVSFSDLSPLRGMGLTSLICRDTSVADLSPLEGMHLTSLDCGDTRVSDLSPLHGMPLATLMCYGTRISTLSPLEGAPLTRLNCAATAVSDLSPLKNAKLSTLACHFTLVSDLRPLQGMPLTELQCQSTPISDLSPLRGMNLSLILFSPERITRGIDVVRQMQSLKAIGIGLDSKDRFSPAEFWKKYDAGQFGKPTAAINDPAFQKWMQGIAVLPADEQVKAVAKKLKVLNPGYDGKEEHAIENGVVTELQISGVTRGDISPVRALTGLKALRLKDGDKTGKSPDFSPLQGMHLTSLACMGMNVSDLSTLKGLPLTSLAMAFNPLSDLRPLAGMKLTVLNCGATAVSDLSPLQGMQLTQLNFDHTKVSDLTPLAGMPLDRIELSRTRVSDLSPLQGMKLSALGFTPGTITRGIDVVRGMKSIESIGIGTESKRKYAADEFWKRYDAGELIPWKTDDFKSWTNDVAAMTVDNQAIAVAQKLQDFNPGFDWIQTYKAENGTVTEIQFYTDSVTDISPVRALGGLKNLFCRGSFKEQRWGTLSDLSPLQGMRLTTLACDTNPVSDLSPLQGMSLTAFSFTPKNITKGMGIVREMKSLKTIGLSWDAQSQIPPAEFWKKYDAGRFKQ